MSIPSGLSSIVDATSDGAAVETAQRHGGTRIDFRRRPELDDDDVAGMALVSGLAAALGVDARLLVMSLHAIVEEKVAFSEDGVLLKFQVGDVATEVGGVLLTDGAPVILRVMASTAGWFVPHLEFAVDGGGANDNAVVRMRISGHQVNTEARLIRDGGLKLVWARPLVATHLFTVSCATATADNPVSVSVVGNGIIPSEKDTAQLAALVRPALREETANGLKLHRVVMERAGQVGGEQAIATRLGARHPASPFTARTMTRPADMARTRA